MRNRQTCSSLSDATTNPPRSCFSPLNYLVTRYSVIVSSTTTIPSPNRVYHCVGLFSSNYFDDGISSTHITLTSLPALLLACCSLRRAMSVCSPIQMCDCLSVRLSKCLSVCLFACLSLCLSICLPACLPVCLSVCSVCLPVCLSSQWLREGQGWRCAGGSHTMSDQELENLMAADGGGPNQID